MENSPSNSIEKQIDNFLEHFKRSASKAMEADWCSSGSGSSNGGLPLNAGADSLCNNLFSGITANGSAINQSPINQAQQQQPLQHPLLQRTKSRSSCLDISDLSERNVKARQLRFLNNTHIDKLIPLSQLGIRAEFEHRLSEWIVKCNENIDEAESPRKGETMSAINEPITPMQTTRKTELKNNDEATNRNTLESNANDGFSDINRHALDITSNSSSHKYLLTTMIPHCLANCLKLYKDNFNSLTQRVRRTLAGAIIDYFHRNNKKLATKIARNLAEQITQHFPTEKKCAWYNRKNKRNCGLLYRRYYKFHRRKGRQSFTNYNCKEKSQTYRNFPNPDSQYMQDTESLESELDGGHNDSRADDQYMRDEEEFLECANDGTRHIGLWLQDVVKSKSFIATLDMWNDTWVYRSDQLKSLQPGHMQQLENLLLEWGSYKSAKGSQLLGWDFEQLYPGKINVYKERWDLFISHISKFLEEQLKDRSSLEFFRDYKRVEGPINNDQHACVFIYLMHAITERSSSFSTPEGSRRHNIVASQRATMRYVSKECDVDNYNESYPCIFIMVESGECIVAFRDLRYNLAFSDALLAAMQLYLVFKLTYPLPCVNFWHFVRDCLFDIQFPEEISYPMLYTLKQYLLMCKHKDAIIMTQSSD